MPYPLPRILFSILLLLLSTGALSAQVPIAYAGPDQDFCSGDTVQLQGSGTNAGPTYTYQWSPTTWLSDPTIPNPMAWPPVETDYTLVVTSNGQVSAPDTVVLRAHVIPTADAGPGLDICLGDTAQLDGTAAGEPLGSYTYTWSPGMWLSDPTLEDPQAFPIEDTRYYFSAVSIWGCPSNVDSMELTIRPTALAEAGPNVIVCAGDSTDLNGSYSWATLDTLPASQVSAVWSPATNVQNPNIPATAVLVDSTRWYYLEITSGSCQHTDSVFVAAIATPSITIQQNGNTLTALGGLGGGSLQWFKDGQPITNATGVNYTVGQPGCYAVLIAEGGCSALSDTICYTTVGLREGGFLPQLDVFPNPFVEQINLEFDLRQAEDLQLNLTNVLGKTVWHTALGKRSAGHHGVSFPIEHLPAGCYFLEIKSTTQKMTIPLLH